jgi:hypothetical protein
MKRRRPNWNFVGEKPDKNKAVVSPVARNVEIPVQSSPHLLISNRRLEGAESPRPALDLPSATLSGTGIFFRQPAFTDAG